MVRNGEILRVLEANKKKFFCRREIQALTGEQNPKNVQSHVARLIRSNQVEWKIGDKKANLIRHRRARP